MKVKLLLLALALGILNGQYNTRSIGSSSLTGSLNYSFNDNFIYVATTGSDVPSCGPIASPCASVVYAVGRAPDNGYTTVLVRDGTYVGVSSSGPLEVNRNLSRWILIRAENRYKAIFTNANNFALELLNAGHVILQGMEFYKSLPGTAAPLTGHLFSACDHVILVDNFIHDSQNNDVIKVNEGSTPVLFIRNMFYNQQGPAGQHIDLNGTQDTFMVNNLHFNNFSSPPTTTNHFVIVKDSGVTHGSVRNWLIGNVMLNWEDGPGSAFIGAGEDGNNYYETTQLHIQNNLFLRNSIYQQRSGFNIKGAENIFYTNNTLVGDGPATEFSFRANDEGLNPPNKNIFFDNNIWSSFTNHSYPSFDSTDNTQNEDIFLNHNVAWMAGFALPTGCTGAPGCVNLVEFSSDPHGIQADPGFPSQSGMLLPIWDNSTRTFPSGTTNIWDELKRLALGYGVPTSSSVLGTSDPSSSPYFDALFRVRGAHPDPGAIQHDGTPTSFQIVTVPTTTADAAFDMNVVILDQPVTDPRGAVIALVSGNPSIVSVPAYVRIPYGGILAPFQMTIGHIISSGTVYIYGYYQPSGGSLETANSRVDITSNTVQVNLAPVSQPSGRTFGLSVALAGPAPPGGATVTLSADQPSLLDLPVSITIPAGQTISSVVSVETFPSPATNIVKITGTLGSASGSSSLTLTPAQLFIDAASGPNFYSGINLPVVMRIPYRAPGGGTTVTLSATEPLATVPASVTIPAGDYKATFTITGATTPTRVFFDVTATLAGAAGSPAVQTFSILPVLMSRMLAGIFHASHNENPVQSIPGSLAFFTGVELNAVGGFAAPVAVTQSVPVLTGISTPLTVAANTSSLYNVPAGATCSPVTSDTSTVLTGTYNSSTGQSVTITCLRPDIGFWIVNGALNPANPIVSVGTHQEGIALNFFGSGGVTNYMPPLVANLTSSDSTIVDASTITPQQINTGADRVLFNINFLKAGTVTLTSTSADTGKVHNITITVQ